MRSYILNPSILRITHFTTCRVFYLRGNKSQEFKKVSSWVRSTTFNILTAFKTNHHWHILINDILLKYSWNIFPISRSDIALCRESKYHQWILKSRFWNKKILGVRSALQIKSQPNNDYNYCISLTDQLTRTTVSHHHDTSVTTAKLTTT